MHPVRVPQEQVNDETVLLVDWLLPDGSEVKAGQPIALIETSKSTAEVEAPQSGYLRHGVSKGTEVAVGGVFCYITTSPTETIAREAEALNKKFSSPVSVPASVDDALRSCDPMPATPASPELRVPSSTHFSSKALVLIEKYGISKEKFSGKGLIREADVMALIAPLQASLAPGNGTIQKTLSQIPDEQIASPGNGATFRSEDLPRIKRVEAKYLAWSQKNTLTSVVSITCQTSGLKAAVSTHPEFGASTSPFIIYEVARLLRKYAVLNSFHHHGKIHLYEAVNVGMALDSGQGLKVPVIFDADKKGVRDIARELENLMLGYVNDDIPISSLAGGTFTITDLSSEDVFLFHPLINQNQCAILGIGAEFHVPGSDVGFFNLILSFDHQLTEGRTAAAFLRELRDRIGSYELALRSGGKKTEPCCARCLRPASELTALKAPLLQEIRPNGERTLICRLCLEGW